MLTFKMTQKKQRMGAVGYSETFGASSTLYLIT